MKKVTIDELISPPTVEKVERQLDDCYRSLDDCYRRSEDQRIKVIHLSNFNTRIRAMSWWQRVVAVFAGF